MPILHGCAYPDCSMRTLRTYCAEHALTVGARNAAERARAIRRRRLRRGR